jgi:lysophospholipase L1-like esterase
MTSRPDPHAPTSPPRRISFDELLRLLADPATPPETLAPYLIVDPDASGAFSPVVVANPALVELPEFEAAVFMAVLNGWSRRVRLKRYRERRARDAHVRHLVSEGDSWFQYPFLLQDVVDQLNRDHAVYCTAAAGDMLTDMIAQDEVVAAVIAEKPAAILISAGGNDLLGKIQTIIEPFDPRRKPEDYLGPTFGAFLEALVTDYRRFLLRLIEHAETAPIFCHAYDYALPRRGGRWLGRPMASIGITDATLQRTIVGLMVDRFHAAMAAIVQETSFAGRVTLVDCRRSVPADCWHDELHPNDRGYALVADRFRAAFARELPEASLESMERTVGEHARPAEEEAMTEAALVLSSDFDETALLHEIGRRIELIKADPGASTIELAEVSSSSYEGVFDAFRDIGRSVMKRIYRELAAVACGDGASEPGTDARLAAAIEAGRIALARYLVGYFGSVVALPVAVATVAAAIVLRSVVEANLPAACAAWQAKAAEP